MIAVEELGVSYTVKRSRGGIAGAALDLVAPRKDVLHAVKALSFTVEAGQIVGYLGANGAGKSSSIKALCGILQPSSGRAAIDGLEAYANERSRREVASRLGVIFGHRTQLLWDLPVDASFELLRAVYRIPAPLFKERLAAFSKFLDIAPLLGKPARQLSLGERVRCEAAAVFMHEPKVVLLDEPTLGLDAYAKDRLREFVKAMNREKGTTVLLTSHDLGDIEALCERIILLERGAKVFDGDLARMREAYGLGKTLIFDLERPAGPVPALDPRSYDVRVERDGMRVVVACQPGAPTGGVAARLLETLPVRDLEIAAPSIEDVLKRFYSGEGLRGTVRRHHGG